MRINGLLVLSNRKDYFRKRGQANSHVKRENVSYIMTYMVNILRHEFYRCLHVPSHQTKKLVLKPISQRILWISHTLWKEVEDAKSQLDGWLLCSQFTTITVFYAHKAFSTVILKHFTIVNTVASLHFVMLTIWFQMTPKVILLTMHIDSQDWS